MSGFQRALWRCAYTSEAQVARSPLLSGPESGLEMGVYDTLEHVELKPEWAERRHLLFIWAILHSGKLVSIAL